jgi:hypothetical protein
VSWEPLAAAWSDADVDAAELWARSGGQWLTDRCVTTVPTHAVRRTAGLAGFLDARGAALAATVGASGVGVIGERAGALGLPPSDTRSCGRTTRLVACADGLVAVSLARADDIASIPAWLGVEGEGDLWPIVEHAVARREAADLVEGAALLGIACSSLGEVADDRPVLVDRAGDAAPRSLEGMVVANLAALWAGPLAADALARLGARVVTIESTSRPDGARATPAFFAALHGRTASVALPLATDAGRASLAALLARADVVIEGSRPRALEQMGIDARSVIASGPRIWLSITAHGRDEPQCRRVGFGDDAAVAGGLVGWAGSAPRFVADAIADPVTGLTGAAVVAHLAEQGGRWLVDLALSRVAASMAPRDGDVVVATRPTADRPRARACAGDAVPLGRDTEAVLAELGIAS